jgi:hypothetical protein
MIMKPIAILAALAACTSAFAGTWSAVSSNCTIWWDSGPSTGFSYYGTPIDPRTSELGVDITRAPTLMETLAGRLSGDNWVYPHFRTVMRYTASPGEVVSTETLHILRWATRHQGIVTADTTEANDYAEMVFDGGPVITHWPVSASGVFDHGEDGTLSGGVPIWNSNADVLGPFQLHHVGGNIYEGTPESQEMGSYRFQWELRYAPFQMWEYHIIQATAMYRRQYYAATVDGAAF